MYLLHFERPSATLYRQSCSFHQLAARWHRCIKIVHIIFELHKWLSSEMHSQLTWICDPHVSRTHCIRHFLLETITIYAVDILSNLQRGPGAKIRSRDFFQTWRSKIQRTTLINVSVNLDRRLGHFELSMLPKLWMHGTLYLYNCVLWSPLMWMKFSLILCAHISL